MVLTVRELNKSTSKIPHIIFLFVLYVLIGVSYYHYIRDHFSLLDALYFAVVTFTTVGYGEFVPKTNSSKLFTCFFIMLGLILIGYFMVIMGEVIIDNDQRMRAMHQTRILSFMDKISAIRISAFNHIKNQFFFSVDTENGADSSGDSSTEGVVNRFQRSESPSGLRNIPYDTVEESELDQALSVNYLKRSHLQSFDDEFELLRRNAISSVFLVLLLLVIGTFVMHVVEGWDTVNAFYWACVTITTVGYGDIAPETKAGKSFTIVYCVVGCVLMTIAWTELVKFPIAMRYKQNELTVMNQFDEDLTAESLSRVSNSDFFESNPRLKTSNKDETSKIEFVLGLLHMMGKVSNKDIYTACKTFDRLDQDSDGIIRNADITYTVRAAKQSSSDSTIDSERNVDDMSFTQRYVVPVGRIVQYLFTGKTANSAVQGFVRVRNDEEVHNTDCSANDIESIVSGIHRGRSESDDIQGDIEIGSIAQPTLVPNLRGSVSDALPY